MKHFESLLTQERFARTRRVRVIHRVGKCALRRLSLENEGNFTPQKGFEGLRHFYFLAALGSSLNWVPARICQQDAGGPRAASGLECKWAWPGMMKRRLDMWAERRRNENKKEKMVVKYNLGG